MARSKSISGSKTSRTSPNPSVSNEPTGNPVNPPVVSAVEATTPAEKVAESKVTPEAKARPETKLAPEPRKFEVLRTEPRKNVLPINLEEEIRRRAYEIYQQRGPGAGNEAEDWLTAEREVKQRYRQQLSA